MVTLNHIRKSNAQVHILQDLVCVFVGGTGGIGESTVKELCKRCRRLKIYLIGRNDQNGAQVVEALAEIDPECEVVFIKQDISLLRDVDKVCAQIVSRENSVNVLFLTAGFMTIRGRNDTDEGLDQKMCVNYYSRMRFILKLAPLLTAAADSDKLSRVITILAAGSEGEVNLDDLDLRQQFSLHGCLAHCVLMTDFMINEFSKRYPGTSFSHSFPGTIKTGIANNLTGPARLALKLLYSVMSPWILDAGESGERHVFQITSQCYPSARNAVGVPCPEGLGPMRGFDGSLGSGAYLLDWNCGPTGDENIVERYKNLDIGPKIWDHTLSMFAQAEQRRQRDSKRPASREADGSGRPAPNISDPIGWRPGY